MTNVAIRAWNLMGGMNWSAIDMVADLLGVTDIETLVVLLTTLRDRQQ